MATKYGERATMTVPEIRMTAALLRALATKTDVDSSEDLDGDVPQAVTSGVGWMRAMAAKLDRVDSDLRYVYEGVVLGLLDGHCPMDAFTPKEWQKTAATLRVLEDRLRVANSSRRLQDGRQRVRRLAQKAEAIAEWWAGWHACPHWNAPSLPAPRHR